MKLLALSILLLAGLAHAGDLTARIKAGKSALAGVEGQRYEATWGAAIGAAITACVPPGSTSPGNLGKFTFVGDVSSTGLVSSVEVQPSTAISRCFAQHFSDAKLPPPPPVLLNSRPALPIADEIEVRP
jgi:hypothetical protein